ncbi:hypothetical protein [Bacillus pseudomycoides]|uniref:hypothetical protein n=1 Tax=Bacillus pseudomycoides TaxID=64104 RepID=UPI000BF63355|nr:hypothetical protein [Bacillus pseudomycoides]PEP82110.1 hypothetical protein CN584_18690 [Bacillus pseudomycoides]PGF07734.1 hypothetical protein COM59_17380 [Bacillus pseudomycoides]
MLNQPMEFAKVIRFDNKGFFPKPYNSSYFHHAFPFLDVDITKLTNNDQILDNENMIIEPHFDDPNTSGCFAFLNEYNPKLFQENGAMYFRSKDKKHTMYLNTEEIIWVRNVNHKNQPFFTQYNKNYVLDDGKNCNFLEYIDTVDVKLNWVRMSVKLALERTRLYKENFPFQEGIPEKITEFYLTERQVNRLISPFHMYKRQFKKMCLHLFKTKNLKEPSN